MGRRNGGNAMNNLKNLAGNDVSLFLFRFELRGNGIDFILNKAIAADMYQDVDEKIKPLAHACCETLARYRRLSVSNTIMDGNILATGEFEVMLSKGLGRHFADDESRGIHVRRDYLWHQTVSAMAWFRFRGRGNSSML